MVLLLALAASRGATAATVNAVGQSHGCLIELGGKIDRRTPQLLAASLRHAAGDECLVRVDSPGGDLDAAIETGKVIRKYNAGTLVSEHARCASACLLLFVGGVKRQAMGEFALHRAYSTRYVTSADQAQYTYRDINARIRQYFDEMNIPERLLDVMNAVPPGQVRVLHAARDQALLKELHIVGEDPVWADRRDSEEARQLGISRQEYYTRQQRMEHVCNAAMPTAANARARVICRYEVMEGRR